MRKLDVRWLTACYALLAVTVCASGSGCQLIESTNPNSTISAPLSLLTNWVSPPLEMAPGFDVEEIRPAPIPALVAPQNVLEVTVWDLYEPGRPYTFPVRVTDDFHVEVPLLGLVGVEKKTIPQIETALVEGYRQGEFLLNPRVIVRSLSLCWSHWSRPLITLNRITEDRRGRGATHRARNGGGAAR